MPQHRFQQLLTDHVTSAVAAGDTPFVPCPIGLPLTPAQLSQVTAVYRIAAERTRQQLRPTRSRMPVFSMN